jgi:anti-anti-sigma regulatory factor
METSSVAQGHRTRSSAWSAQPVCAGGRLVVVVTGELDASAHPEFGERLRQLTGDAAEPVVDLSGVRLLTGAAVRQVRELADTFAGTGRRLRIVTGTGPALRVLRAAQATDVLETYVTLTAAGGAGPPHPGSAATPDATQLERLRLEVAALRSKLATRPVIARALGVLEERYGLPDMDAAFRLLRGASQYHNVRLWTLARTLVELPRPYDGDRLADALRHPPPPLDFGPGRPATPAAVLAQLLDVATDGAGYTQLPDHDGLRLAGHRGLGEDFAVAFARLAGEQSTCTVALRKGAVVTSTDIGQDPLFGGAVTRDVLLGAGFRAARSTPVLTPAGECAAVVTTLAEPAGHDFDGPAQDRLDLFAREAGRWLHWHGHRQALLAVRHLHERATARAPG